MIEFFHGEVPVGQKFYWEEAISSDRSVDITSEQGKPINVYLTVELVTDKVSIDDDLVQTEIGEKMRLSSAYEIKLMQNKIEIEPNTMLTVKIKLSQEELNSNLALYYLNNDKELVNYDFKIENGKLVFITDHLSNWLIFSDYDENNTGDGDGNTYISYRNAIMLIGIPILLAIATMLYALRLKQKHNEIARGDKE